MYICQQFRIKSNSTYQVLKVCPRKLYIWHIYTYEIWYIFIVVYDISYWVKQFPSYYIETRISFSLLLWLWGWIMRDFNDGDLVYISYTLMTVLFGAYFLEYTMTVWIQLIISAEYGFMIKWKIIWEFCCTSCHWSDSHWPDRKGILDKSKIFTDPYIGYDWMLVWWMC